MSRIDVELGLGKPRRDCRVVVAMSGGVDSSTVAGLIVESGYQAVGMTLQLYDHGAATGRPGACCAGQDIHDARRVADRLGMPHYVLDYETRFRRDVIEDFADSYARGETPIPCIRCNERVKFRDLLETARSLGADALVTGHYARRVEGAGGLELHRAAEAARDQSYFLFATTQAQLGFLRFPLGGLSKAEVRGEAQRLGLVVAEKPDSQDICFVPNGRYASLVSRLRPGAAEPGEIVDLAGRVLGRHDGTINFTVGQRRGVGIAAAEPLYVVRIEPAARRVVVGPRAALMARRVVLREVNWLGDAPAAGAPLTARLRSSHPGAPARLEAAEAGGALLRLDEAEPATAPGQACVLYDGTRLVGGGWISRMTPDALDGQPANAGAAAVAAASA
ncbi:MAG: tRNA 2-thiouridine(34) synthase MnmA [Alphaproteobacteria bacterium]